MDYIKYYNLKPADRIVVPKSLAGIVQHHAVYLGQNYSGQDLIAENVAGKFVRVVTADDFFQANPKVTRIERFTKNNYERRVAIERALKLLGKPYDLINFNCEHFANYVQHGKIESFQIGRAVFGFIAFIIVVGILSE